MRRRSAIAAVLALGALLAGCAAEEPPAPDPLTQVQVSGEYGEAPLVTIGDLSGLGAEPVRTVVIEGDGPETTPETFINASVAVYDGETKQQALEYQSLGQVFATSEQDLPEYFADIFVGVPGGSRVVVIVPGDVMTEGMDEPQQDPMLPADETPEPTAPSVFVADIDAIPSLSAWGETQDPTQDLVTVADGDDDSPQIEIEPGAVAPDELVLDVRRAGDGPEVADGDTVLVQYRGVLFDGGEEFDSSWSRGEPSQFATNQVVPGFGQALVGQPTGSQVIAIIPPDLAYGEAGSGDAVPPNATLVFVVDILAVL